MPVSIKNPEVERLISEVTALTGETKTEAIRKSLEERRERLRYLVASEDRAARIRRFLAEELWPVLPEDEVGRRLSREEEASLLGYGKEGV
jgi:antitoxin VapB